MDPLSITAACVSVSGAIAKSLTSITSFVRTFTDARRDLMAVASRLTELQIVLELLKEKSDGTNSVVPETIQSQVKSIVESCRVIIADLDAVLAKHRQSSSRSMRWAISGKEKVAALDQHLSAHMSALDIALDVSTLAISRGIKESVDNVQSTTVLIRGDTTDIKDDTARILSEIGRLRLQLPTGVVDDTVPGPLNPMMEAYLDFLASYAASVIDEDISWSDDESRGTGVSPVPSPPSTSSKSVGKSLETSESQSLTSLGSRQLDDASGSHATDAPVSSSKEAPEKVSGNSKYLSIQHELNGHTVSFVPNQDICVVLSEGRVSFHVAADGRLIKGIRLPNLHLSDAARKPFFSPDGTWMALITNDGRGIYAVETRPSQSTLKYCSHYERGNVLAASFSPNNLLLAYSTKDPGCTPMIWIRHIGDSGENGECELIKVDAFSRNGPVYQMAFTLDGDSIVYNSYYNHCIEIASGITERASTNGAPSKPKTSVEGISSSKTRYCIRHEKLCYRDGKLVWVTWAIRRDNPNTPLDEEEVVVRDVAAGTGKAIQLGTRPGGEFVEDGTDEYDNDGYFATACGKDSSWLFALSRVTKANNQTVIVVRTVGGEISTARLPNDDLRDPQISSSLRYLLTKAVGSDRHQIWQLA